jgi:hypothetical protein
MRRRSTFRSEITRPSYDRIYEQGSSRLANEGLIGMRYRLPKYLSFVCQRYGHCGPLEVLEIGAGVGEMARMVLNAELSVRRYVGIEYSLPAVKNMHRQGLLTAQMNAERLAFPDNSFDLVLGFDVVHHSDHPELMAREIVRVSRRHFLLCESNGLSPVRKLAELSPLARSLGERSYLPWRYRAFFPRDEVQLMELRPFYVLVPPHAPEALIPLIVDLSELGERVPGLRWIGQSLLIVGEKRQGS